MINAAKIFLPPLAEYQIQLQRIMNNQRLSDREELALRLEERLKIYLEVDNNFVTYSDAIPIQIF